VKTSKPAHSILASFPLLCHCCNFASCTCGQTTKRPKH